MKLSRSKIILLASPLLAILLYFALGQRVSLLATGDIKIISDPGGGVEIGVIYAGQTVPVLRCEDLKHYIVPKVKLANGTEGYVLRGDFKIDRQPSWFSSSAPISFTC